MHALQIHAQDGSIKLIVRGDDMGYSHAGNEALIKCFKEGIQTSIEVIVPSPWFPEAVQMLRQNPKADVGVHLALTSEWDNIKWRPLTHCPSLVDSNGYFFPMIWPNKNYPGKALSEHAWKLEEIENELRAQIVIAKRNIPSISHISAHMGCIQIDEKVKALVKKLATEFHVDIDPEVKNVKYVTYNGPKETSEQKISSFVSMLKTLQPGNTYLFVDHPGLDSPELRAIHHIGYENVAVDRQGVTNLFTSEVVKSAIRKMNIKLISYADLRD
jgi:predicted glycoside hydrolase/deacetylase ChbG (UPF0249 family)